MTIIQQFQWKLSWAPPPFTTPYVSLGEAHASCLASDTYHTRLVVHFRTLSRSRGSGASSRGFVRIRCWIWRTRGGGHNKQCSAFCHLPFLTWCPMALSESLKCDFFKLSHCKNVKWAPTVCFCISQGSPEKQPVGWMDGWMDGWMARWVDRQIIDNRKIERMIGK